MARVGVLTYHHTFNNGAQLQAACLQRFLAQQGFEAEIVDYRPLRASLRLLNTRLRSGHQERSRNPLQRWKNQDRFLGAISEIATLSPRPIYTDQGLLRQLRTYDIVICGSDEIWNFGNYRGYARAYIFDFDKRLGARRISYAASLGNFEPSDTINNRMKNALTEFATIMVRDPHTQDYVTGLGLSATMVADPVFLTDLPIDSAPSSDYLMLSGQMPSANVNGARNLARTLSLPLVSPGYCYPGHEDLYVPATPIEWAGWIKHARAHITTLFHGTALSIRYNTPFAVWIPSNKRRKIQWLLEQFALASQALSDHVSAEVLHDVLSTPVRDSCAAGASLVSDSKRLLMNALRSGTTASGR